MFEMYPTIFKVMSLIHFAILEIETKIKTKAWSQLLEFVQFLII